MAKGMNLKSVKSENRSMILYMLNTYGSLSRKEIAGKLSLTPAAVTKICNELIDEGFIKESGFIDSNGKSGRREVLLSLCLEDKLVLGVNAEKNGIQKIKFKYNLAKSVRKRYNIKDIRV